MEVTPRCPCPKSSKCQVKGLLSVHPETQGPRGRRRRGWASHARNLDSTKHQEVRSPFGGLRMVTVGPGTGTGPGSKARFARAGELNKSRTILDELWALARAERFGAIKMGHPHVEIVCPSYRSSYFLQILKSGLMVHPSLDPVVDFQYPTLKYSHAVYNHRTYLLDDAITSQQAD
jgi:hypothetical protein